MLSHKLSQAPPTTSNLINIEFWAEIWFNIGKIRQNIEAIGLKFESDPNSKIFTCLHSQGLKTHWGPQNYNINSQPNAHATTRHHMQPILMQGEPGGALAAPN